MKNIRKITIILIIFLIFSYLFTNNISNAEFAHGSGTSSSKSDTIDSVMQGANSFVSDGEDKVDGYTDEEGVEHSPIVNEYNLKTSSNFIYNLFLGIAIVMAVAIGSILGVKFMISSVEEQAKIKELLVPYVVGCIVVFGAFGIWKIAVEIFKAF